MLPYPLLTYAHLDGFIDELSKEAVGLDQARAALRGAGGVAAAAAAGTAAVKRFIPRVMPALGSRAAGLGMSAGALAGGVGNAAYQGHKAYQEAREQGASAGEAGIGAAFHGLSGGMTGAALGGALGAGGGAALDHLRPGVGLNAPKALDTLTHFGQRQLHSLTGAAPEVAGMTGRDALRHVGGGAADAVRAERAATDAVTAAVGHAHAGNPDAAKAVTEALDAQAGARKAVQGAEAAETADLTSIPGYIRGMRYHPIDTLRTAGKETMSGAHGVLPKVMMGTGVALGGMDAVSALRGDPAPPGSPQANQGKFERVGHALGNVGGSFLGAGLPMVGQMGLGALASGTGRIAGKAVDLGVAGVNKLRNMTSPSPVAPPPGDAPGAP